MKKENTCCFTGPRPKRLPCFGDPAAPEMKKLRSLLRDAILSAYRDGYRFFMSGMAEGFDLMAAEEVLSLKEELRDIALIAVFPYAGAAAHHAEVIQKQIRDIPLATRFPSVPTDITKIDFEENLTGGALNPHKHMDIFGPV